MAPTMPFTSDGAAMTVGLNAAPWFSIAQFLDEIFRLFEGLRFLL
jgi:hypothetical protein